ncbi:hypothetical protein Hanom_Chr03g00180201 [Helianthus anomalus]
MSPFKATESLDATKHAKQRRSATMKMNRWRICGFRNIVRLRMEDNDGGVLCCGGES